MLFNSLHFLAFLPVVLALYFATPNRWKWVLLLTASYYFYAAWRVEYLVLIMASTGVDYVAGIRMGKHESRRGRRPWLIVSLFTNLGLLFSFKYLNFASESLQAAFDQFNVFYGIPTFDVLLPVGISFYTFQTLSYTIDVYRGRQEPERHLGILALYVSFFPQLVAGPIERSTRLLPQFFREHGFDLERAKSGARLMLWGFFKKVVIADRLAAYVNPVYADPTAHSSATLLVATYFFAFQIYCDFSGYSDIAIGTARIMGYDLMENFRRPYFARSIREFWGRWHISLSTWFRDYVYIPLGGNRVPRLRWYVNLMIVFVVSGLWHGAAWTFILWGALHGGYLVFALVTSHQRDRIWASVKALSPSQVLPGFRASWLPHPSIDAIRSGLAVFTTFHLVLFAWIFFRAETIREAWVVIANIVRWEPSTQALSAPAGLWQFRLALVAVGVLLVAEVVEGRWGGAERLLRLPVPVRWMLYWATFFAILGFGVVGGDDFIYFQF
ncbi:MAG: MBOAT family protein [Gemmatimonadota bacterium]